MKKLATLLISLIVLTPAFAMAEQGRGGQDDTHPEIEMHSTFKAEVHGGDIKAGLRANASSTSNKGPGSANSGPGSLPKLGPAIRDIASTSRAFGSSTVEMVKARVEAIKQIIAKKREDMKERAENAKKEARERFGEHVETLVGNVSARLASSSANLSSIADRIDARIDTLEDEGHDMSVSIALLATARTDISVANDKILAVNTALETAMATTSPKGQIPAVRAAVKAAEDALKLAKEDLMKTLRSVKAESGATTTASH